MSGNLLYSEDIKSAWYAIIVKPKWYAGILTKKGSFYSAPNAFKLKKRFEEGSLSLDVVATILKAHGFDIVVSTKKAS